MKIDTSPLAKAIVQFERSLSFLNSDMAKSDEALREQFRAAVIQAFEFTYELTIKMIRRQLEQISESPQDIREMDFMQLMRTAHGAGLIADPIAFKTYREMRNITSHSYDGNKANLILEEVDDFLADAKLTLQEINQRNHD